MTDKPSIFIGSSKEDMLLANAVFTELEDVFEPSVWDQDLFAPSSYVLEGLEKAIKEFDYAVLVLGSNDKRVSRGRTSQVPRDNVIAELGFFMGALGRRNVFVLTPGDTEVDLPTDFLGLVTLPYRQRPDANNRAAVRTACEGIKHEIASRGREPATGANAARSVWPLGVALVGRDAVSLTRLEERLGDYAQISNAMRFEDGDGVREAIAKREVDAIFVDLCSLDPEVGLDLIAYVRDRHREIGVALYGTFKELYELPGVSPAWRETLQHYWKMPKDAQNEAFAVTVEDIMLFFFIYRLSGGRFGERPSSVALAMMTPDVAGSWPLWQGLP